MKPKALSADALRVLLGLVPKGRPIDFESGAVRELRRRRFVCQDGGHVKLIVKGTHYAREHRWENRPEALYATTCYREDGTPIYSGLHEEKDWEDVRDYYTKGHPSVYAFRVMKYVPESRDGVSLPLPARRKKKRRSGNGPTSSGVRELGLAKA